jgi:hypothetical protein
LFIEIPLLSEYKYNADYFLKESVDMMENNEDYGCPLSPLCERLGTIKPECARASMPRFTALESARRKYNGDLQLARLDLIEEDIDRLRACVMTVLKLLA